MTSISLLVGLAAIAGAIGLAVFLVGNAASGRVAAGPVEVVTATESESAALSSLLRRAAGLGNRFSSSSQREKTQFRLDLAGNPRSWTPERLMAFKGIGLVGGLLIGLIFGAGSSALIAIGAPTLLGAFGLVVPDILVKNLGERRQVEVQTGLADALDMLTVCVEAGLGFDAAIGRVARNQTGPVAQEWARVLQEMQFGKSRSEALRSLLTRTDVPELRVFVSAVIQSSELGISIGDVLREQSKEMRIKRRQRAEEQAQKLQVKLLMPLITCLLPAIFIVVLGPAVLSVVTFFGQVNK
jgi:tight adherence protein C